jgi:hypothetical protein
MLVHLSIHAAICVLFKEVADSPSVPVENGPDKRGGRLPDSAGYSRVLPLGYKMSWVLYLGPGGQSQQ